MLIKNYLRNKLSRVGATAAYAYAAYAESTAAYTDAAAAYTRTMKIKPNSLELGLQAFASLGKKVSVRICGYVIRFCISYEINFCFKY